MSAARLLGAALRPAREVDAFEFGRLVCWSKNRDLHNLGADTFCCTSKDFMCDVRYPVGAGGPIDAPGNIAAGGMFQSWVLGLGMSIERGTL